MLSLGFSLLLYFVGYITVDICNSQHIIVISHFINLDAAYRENPLHSQLQPKLKFSIIHRYRSTLSEVIQVASHPSIDKYCRNHRVLEPGQVSEIRGVKRSAVFNFGMVIIAC
jgi:hypothetical protein